MGLAVAVADDGTLCPSAPQDEWALGGFVDERVLDVAQFEEFAVAVAAFAVVAEEASAGAHCFTGVATLGAAAWALDACPVVVYVTDDEVAFSIAGGVGRLVVHTVDDGRCAGGRGPGDGSDSKRKKSGTRSFSRSVARTVPRVESGSRLHPALSPGAATPPAPLGS